MFCQPGLASMAAVGAPLPAAKLVTLPLTLPPPRNVLGWAYGGYPALEPGIRSGLIAVSPAVTPPVSVAGFLVLSIEPTSPRPCRAC